MGAVYQPVTFVSGSIGRDSVTFLVLPVVALEPVTFISSFVGRDSTSLLRRFRDNSGPSSVALMALLFCLENVAPC